MTREELESRYTLVEEVGDGGDVRTHHAVAAGGTVVMVHFVRPATPRGDAVLRRLEQLEGSDAERILRTHEVDGERVIVTRFLMEEGSLEGWLRPEPEAQDEGSDEAGEPGEFTRLFKAMSPPEDGRDDAPASPTAPPDPPPETPAQSDGGEFTRLFRAIRPGPGEEGADASADGAPAEAEPGESDLPGGRDAPSDAGAEPGEFTRLFRAMRPGPGEEGGATDEPTPPRPASPATPPEPAQRPAARWREAPPEPQEDSRSGGPQDASPETRPAQPGNFTQEFGRVARPGGEESPGSGAPPSPRPPPPSPPRRTDPPSQGAARPPAIERDPLPPDDDYLSRLRSPGGSPPAPPPPPTRAARDAPPDAQASPPAARRPGGRPPERGAPGPPSAPPPPPGPSASAGPRPTGGAPSEFTRVIAAQGRGALPQGSRGSILGPPLPGTGSPPAPRGSSAGPSGPPGGGGGPSTLLLLVGMGAIFLLALVLILVFALRSDSAGETPEGPPVEEVEAADGGSGADG